MKQIKQNIKERKKNKIQELQKIKTKKQKDNKNVYFKSNKKIKLLSSETVLERKKSRKVLKKKMISNIICYCGKKYILNYSQTSVEEKIDISTCLFCHPISTGNYKITDSKKIEKYIKKWNLNKK